MEEDIKKIESFIAIMKSDFRKGLYYKDELEAIEHLLKAYKELKYKYNKALSDLVKAEYKNKEIEEENKKLKSSLTNTAVAHANSIDVSLVEKKIEELKKHKISYEKEFKDKQDEDYYFDINVIDGEIKVLQELLEKRK